MSSSLWAEIRMAAMAPPHPMVVENQVGSLTTFDFTSLPNFVWESGQHMTFANVIRPNKKMRFLSRDKNPHFWLTPISTFEHLNSIYVGYFVAIKVQLLS